MSLFCSRCKKVLSYIEALGAINHASETFGHILCRGCRNIDLVRRNRRECDVQKNQEEAPINRFHVEGMLKLEQQVTEKSRATGKKYHVEHIVPLGAARAASPVCGLHVPWNASPGFRKINMGTVDKFDDHDAQRVERGHMEWLRARRLTAE